MFTTLPPPTATMCGTQSWVSVNAASTLNRNAASTDRALVCGSGRGSQPPALFTRMSTRPSALTVESTSAASWSVSVTSVGTTTALRPSADLLGDHFQVGLRAGRERDVCARFRESDRAPGADALTRAGDDRDAALRG